MMWARAQAAVLEPARDKRGEDRKRLRLEAVSSTTHAGRARVLVHDISQSGILFESTADLMVDEVVQVDLPTKEQVSARIRWSSGDLFGCEFEEPISSAAVSAAMLISPPYEGPQSEAKPWYAEEPVFPDPHLEPFPSWMRAIVIVGLAALSWGAILLIASTVF
ncbi:PilZ domain-containing protein [Altererythrobacter sp. B11]|uniref:PilZ domain-containing protein n=1 Tax=Altererythrobacter sp. B11 TaxID=2060312 RepID=UPI000DC7385C|nr:PilZ domain-containing protein [Altererythrobacter sp. B11]BBC72252.1 PilZ domain-containing protein [Altererythrobacter sp. B11]